MLRLIVGTGVRLVFLGLAVGICVAFALTRLMTDLLYGVRATDVLTFGGVIIVLALTSLMACYIPARRAMRSIYSWPCSTSKCLGFVSF